MNFTKQDRDKLYKSHNDASKASQRIIDKLVEDCDSLERLLITLRDSRQCVVSNNASTAPTLAQLSEVPSDLDIHKKAIEFEKTEKDEDATYINSWSFKQGAQWMRGLLTRRQNEKFK